MTHRMLTRIVRSPRLIEIASDHVAANDAFHSEVHPFWLLFLAGVIVALAVYLQRVGFA